jgi:O-antigen/teichoic acid export membrane protein
MGILKKLVREDNFLSLSGNLTIAVLGIAGFALLARSLSLHVFGEWVLFVTGGSFIEMFRFGITNTALIRFLSGSEGDTRESLIGSNTLIGLTATVGIALLLLGCNSLFGQAIAAAGYQVFFEWYPLLAFLNLPWNNALVVLQAQRQYDKMLIVKALKSGLFFFIVLVHFFFFEMTLEQLVLGLLVANATTSFLTLVLGWDGSRYITKAKASTNKTLLNFGKYTTFTLIGSNLLRSADTFIISLSPLGSAAVALYSIPLKLTELQQIPLRSFVATAFPKMSQASLHGKITEVKMLFNTYSGAMTYLFTVMGIFTFVFADYLVLFLSGEQYLSVDSETGTNVVTIVRVFSFYGLLLPLDRMTGVALDSINKPQVNALKVFVMVVANILGDALAIFIFESLLLVAVTTILFTILGIALGMYFLNKELRLYYRDIFSSGIHFYKGIFNKISNGRYALAHKKENL